MKAFIVSIGLVVLSVSVSAGLVTVDPDGSDPKADISMKWSSYVTLSSGGGASGLDGKVYAETSSYVSAGNLVFAHNSISGSTSSRLWLTGKTSGYYLRVDFVNPTNHIMIDVIGDSDSDVASMWLYTSGGASEQRMSSVVGPRQKSKFEIQHQTADIVAIEVGGFGSASKAVLLDNLQFEVPEPATCLILLSGWLLVKTRKR